MLADKLKNTLRQTREALTNNLDQHDPKFITLKEELERLFKKKNLNEVTKEEMNANIKALNEIHEKVKELNRENNQIHAGQAGLHADHHVGDFPRVRQHLFAGVQAWHLVVDDSNADGVVAAGNIAVKHVVRSCLLFV